MRVRVCCPTGERQSLFGQSLFDQATAELSGPVDFIHTYIDMSNFSLVVNGTTVSTCLPGMGYSFAAGPVGSGQGCWGVTASQRGETV